MLRKSNGGDFNYPYQAVPAPGGSLSEMTNEVCQEADFDMGCPNPLQKLIERYCFIVSGLDAVRIIRVGVGAGPTEPRTT